ncbi:MAG: F-type H+-transporting ATPase subunit a [Rickettsiales bacterium]|jgi:F-type H+-transporting ATPase subunit a
MSEASPINEIAGQVASEIVHETSNGGHGPLAQFEIKKIFDINLAGIDISFTNSSLYMVLATFCAIAFMFFATRKKMIIPSRLQVTAELVYNFIMDMVKTSIGNEGNKFFPLVFTLFIFVLLCNLLGLTPYSFTVTSHIAVTFALAMIAFLTITIYAIARNGFGGFLHMFLPSGVPLVMAPFIFAIELFSFLIKPVTLSVRLFANIVAGHVLLKVVAGFIISLGVIFGAAPLFFAVLMTGFELFVAVLQSYIFAILVCAYLGETTRQH